MIYQLHNHRYIISLVHHMLRIFLGNTNETRVSHLLQELKDDYKGNPPKNRLF